MFIVRTYQIINIEYSLIVTRSDWLIIYQKKMGIGEAGIVSGKFELYL
jgi:hypothetical protein